MKLNMRSGVWSNLIKKNCVECGASHTSTKYNFELWFWIFIHCVFFLVSVTIGQGLEFTLLALTVKDMCHHLFSYLHVHISCLCGLLHAVVSWQGQNLVSAVAGLCVNLKIR